MKRWLVFGLIALALIVIVSPGLIGQRTQTLLDESLSNAAEESGAATVIAESYDRSWFSAEGRHRIVFNPETRKQLEDFTGDSGFGDQPALIVDTVIDHGLIPIGALSRGSGSIAPGLANTVSTFKFDTGKGKVIDLPGKLVNKFGLNGASDSHYLLQAGSAAFAEGAATLTWTDTDIHATANAGATDISVAGDIESLSLKTSDGQMEIDGMDFSATQNRNDFGFVTGNTRLVLGSLSANDGAAQSIDVTDLQLDGESALNGDDAEFDFTMSMADLDGPGFTDIAVDIEMEMRKIDARSFQKVIEVLRETRQSGNTGNALNQAYPSIEADIMKIAAGGPSIDIKKLNIKLPQGDVETRLKLELGESDPNQEMSIPGLMMSTTGSADIAIPKPLLDMLKATNPQAEQGAAVMIGLGYLVLKDDRYTMSAEYKGGLLSINGVPTPLPMLGM